MMSEQDLAQSVNKICNPLDQKVSELEHRLGVTRKLLDRCVVAMREQAHNYYCVQEIKDLLKELDQ